MLQRRFQILLDDERFHKVEREAGRRGISIAAVIREAIDRLPSREAERRAAALAFLAAEPMEVPDDPADLRRELDEAHDRLPR
ncbi:MAG TPA: ribbon-helix-helix protein, CopG family [Dehalococcoidia bacterium]|nr:ribbon-helix-helix protein, CopG family [Dehalococcoidia bacterium]